MNTREKGFLLLTSHLGDAHRKPLTVAQFRNLAQRVRDVERTTLDRELLPEDLILCGCSYQEAERILQLLNQEELLDYYLQKAQRANCVPVTRVNPAYPPAVRKCLGDDSPGVLWTKGEMSILQKPCIALVGSRELHQPNRDFAKQVGRAAAEQGYALVSGNARGADRTAQDACLDAGGSVICVTAEALSKHSLQENVLYLAENGFDLPFSSLRALSRNRVIHALAQKTFVAQARIGAGGTWSGTVQNLRGSWSQVFCFDDGSPAAYELAQLGAELIRADQLADMQVLRTKQASLFDT